MFHFIRPSLTRWLGGMLVLLVVSFTLSNYKEGIDKQDVVQKSSDLPAMSNIVKQNYISELVTKERMFINENLLNYPTLKLSNLRRNIMEKGGRPTTSLLVSSWRSGSSFVGQILSSHPVSLYHYEPLHQYGLVRLRSGAVADRAVSLVSSLLHCEYSGLEQFLGYQRTQASWCYAQNKRLWASCTRGGVNGTGSQAVCFQPQFAAQFCQLFPFQAVKTVRLRLSLTESLIQDQRLDVRAVLLVRDPRAVLESRKHKKDFFKNCSDCQDPEVLCSDMFEDFLAAKSLMKKYPGRYQVMRYEDLVKNPLKISEEMFKFYKIPFHRDVLKFVLRNNQDTGLRWMKGLPGREILEIQDKSADAMEA